MKTVLLHLLVFISLHVIAQSPQVAKVKSIFASQQFTITVTNLQGQNTYAFKKQITNNSTAWLMSHNQHLSKKIIWDNYLTLQNKLINEISYYYAVKPSYIYINYTDDETSYKIANQTDSVLFNQPYFSIPKLLHHVGWEPNPGHFHGNTGGFRHG